jgi:hypothetical protein
MIYPQLEATGVNPGIQSLENLEFRYSRVEEKGYTGSEEKRATTYLSSNFVPSVPLANWIVPALSEGRSSPLSPWNHTPIHQKTPLQTQLGQPNHSEQMTNKLGSPFY